MKKYLIGILVITLLSSAVYAQHQMGRGFGKQMRMQEKNLDNLRLIKLLDLLELSDGQNDKFIAAYSSHRIESRQIREEIETEVQTLTNLIQAENPNDALIQKQIDKVEGLMEQMLNSVRKLHNKMKEILTVVQMGKMIVFENRFERELLETVRGFREKHGMMPDDDSTFPPNDIMPPDGRP
ncbi:MAG: hypothetical protein ABIJ45_07530 [Candidatus Zixiibacteriota bacterium]